MLEGVRKRVKSLPNISVFCFAILEEASEDRTLVTAPEAIVVLAFDDVLKRGPTCRECLNWSLCAILHNLGKGLLYILDL